MPIDVVCTGCGRALRVPDNLSGKQARCPQCQSVFQVPQVAAASAQPPASTPALSGALDRWYMQTPDGENYGPIPKAELDRWMAEGRVTGDCQVLREGDSAWRWAGELYPALGGGGAIGGAGGKTAGGATSGGGDDSPFANLDFSGRGAPVNPYASPVVGAGRPFQSGGTTYNHKRPPRGPLILVLGILSLVCCGCFTGIPAWIMGNNDLSEMRSGRMNKSGYGLTQAGMICGIIGTVFSFLYLFGGVLNVAFNPRMFR